jgi:hypothetical protein
MGCGQFGRKICDKAGDGAFWGGGRGMGWAFELVKLGGQMGATGA